MKIYKQLEYIKGFRVNLRDGNDEFDVGRDYVGVMIKRFGPWFRKFRILSCLGRWKYANCWCEPRERCMLWHPLLTIKKLCDIFMLPITSDIITSIFLENSRGKDQWLIFFLISRSSEEWGNRCCFQDHSISKFMYSIWTIKNPNLLMDFNLLIIF